MNKSILQAELRALNQDSVVNSFTTTFEGVPSLAHTLSMECCKAFSKNDIALSTPFSELEQVLKEGFGDLVFAYNFEYDPKVDSSEPLDYMTLSANFKFVE